jgi:hypothetical protein
MFVRKKFFQVSHKFASKVGYLLCLAMRMTPSLARKHWTWLKKLVTYKHFSFYKAASVLNKKCFKTLTPGALKRAIFIEAGKNYFYTSPSNFNTV